MDIDFEDIRTGDLIKVTWQTGDVSRTSEGIVYEKDYSQLYSEGGHLIGDSFFNLSITYELLKRPERALPDEGTWVRVRTTYGDTFIGMMQYSHGRKFVETLNTIIEPEEIKDWDVLDWGVGE